MAGNNTSTTCSNNTLTTVIGHILPVAICALLSAISIPLARAESSSNQQHFSVRSAVSHATSSGVAPTLDGKEFLHKLFSHAQKIENYSSLTQLKVYNGQSPIIESGHFYFKKPGMIKLSVIDGKRKGSCVVVDRNGEVHAHYGGMMKHIKMKLDKDSHMLRLPTGFSVLEGDFASLLGYMSKLVNERGQCRLTASPESVPGEHDKQYVLEVSHPSRTADDATYRIDVNAKTNLPDRVDIFRKGHLSSTTTWSHVNLNPGLDNEFFRL